MLVIVRHGAAVRFHELGQLLAGQPVEVIWDRRFAERRQASRRRQDRRVSAVSVEADRRVTERRQAARRHRDRRHRPPPSWTALDFVVVMRAS